VSKIRISAAPLATESDADAPLPLALCWLIWVSAALGLWALILSPFM